MLRRFTLEYWKDNEWYVGIFKGLPGVFSQGKSLLELEENIKEAYLLMVEEQLPETRSGMETKEITLDIARSGVHSSRSSSPQDAT